MGSALFEYGQVVSTQPLLIAHSQNGSIDQYGPSDFATGPFIVISVTDGPDYQGGS
ncbi:hypothetical protein [Allohahella marinimesophila]|uniref:hypothetical protein n=1 Tax=Allohahella marinimesophila TaxID=1054972 RepID=UPI0031D6DB51